MAYQNLTLLTDLYELTMMQGYFNEQSNDTVVFDAFYRKNPSGNGFAITAGLEQIIDYVKNLSFSYDDNEVLKDISLEIPEKTMTAFVGSSGAGKTTLAMLIARFWDVNKGSISIGGRDVRDYTLESLMSHISVVFQHVYLFADTIENNIKFGMKDASHEDVITAAKKACCHDFIMSLPEGYSTVIGEGGATLSGGEKQRISIARAILKDAPVIILDEATANVDPENEDKLIAAFNALTENKTVIMIAHRLKTIRNADQLVVLDGEGSAAVHMRNCLKAVRNTAVSLSSERKLQAGRCSPHKSVMKIKLDMVS